VLFLRFARIDGRFLDRVISAFAKCGKDALAVFVPIETRKDSDLGPSTDEYGTWYAVSGVNVINGERIRDEGKIATSAIITEEIEVLLNINTQNDLVIAEEIIKKVRRE
jgi:GTP:adenosylcobinamide-phosphate guanylyltransferase